MLMTPFHHLTLHHMSQLLRRRECSPVEITQALLARVAVIEPEIDAFFAVTRDLALAQAREAETQILRGNWRGPLHGIPYGLKDVIRTAGIRTTAGSRVLADYVPDVDAAVAGKLRDAGAILLGKLATPEFAHGSPSFDLPRPPPRNPWDTARQTGGSSSGSAAAVAAGLMPFALGTDTGGSIRVPSWMCGVVGFKPTYERVSRSGVIPFSPSCDHVGPITWTARDAAIVLAAIESEVRCPIDTAALDGDIRGMKIGFVRHFGETDREAPPELRAAADDALRALSDLGAVVDDVALRPLRDYYPIRVVITESELLSLHMQSLRRSAHLYGHDFLSRCVPALLFGARDYVAAQHERRKITNEMELVFRDYDALVTVGAGPAPRFGEPAAAADVWLNPSMSAQLCALASLSGIPAAAVPCGISREGLPLGIQILGGAWQDEKVLRIAHAYEAHAQVARRRPEVGQRAAIDAGEGEQKGVRADERLRPMVESALHAAGFSPDSHFGSAVLTAAPHLLEMTRRMREAAENDCAWLGSTCSTIP